MFHYIRLDKLASDKHSSLLGPFVSYRKIKCCKYYPCGHIHNTLRNLWMDPISYCNTLTSLKRFRSDKNSSVLGPICKLQKIKCFKYYPCGCIHNNLCNLWMGPVRYSDTLTSLERLRSDKHSSLLGPFENYKKSSVVNTNPMTVFITLYVTYEWVQ